MRFLRYGRNDLTLVLVIVVGDIRRWENDQSLVVCKQNMVTDARPRRYRWLAIPSLRSLRPTRRGLNELKKRIRLLDYARNDKKTVTSR